MSSVRLGLDVGGTFLKVAGLDGDEVTDLGRIQLPGEGVIGFASTVASDLVERFQPVAVGVGLAGLVDSERGEFIWGPHLPGPPIKVKSELESTLRVPVVVDNDANLAALAESHLGAGTGSDPVLIVALGTGIGMGLVIGGKVYRGAGLAGEAGHMTVRADAALCECGRTGCWETLVSGTVLDREAARILGSSAYRPATAADLVRAARAGNEAAIAAVTDAGRWLGLGISNLVAVLDPAVVVVGGAVAEAGDLLLDPARREISGRLSGAEHRPAPKLVPARFGSLSGAVGAALATRSLIEE